MPQLVPTTRRLRRQRETIARFATPRELRVDAEPQDYRSFFDNAVEGIFRTTPEGRYLAANRALATMYRYASPEQMLAAFTDIGAQLYVDPQRRSLFRMLMSRQDTVTGFEAEVRCRDGSTIWIREKARVVRDAAGQLQCYEGFVEDITAERRERLGALLCQRAFACASDGLALFDAGGALAWENAAFQALVGNHGATSDRLLGALTPHGAADAWRASRAALMRCGAAFRDEVVLRDGAGQPRALRLAACAVTAADGSRGHVLVKLDAREARS